jgi:predicted enzyme related to lactoylglutathione lyase
VGLSQVEKAGGEGGAVLTFGVKDIDAARKRLETADVRFDGDTQTIPDMVKLATFFDPDGNALMLFQDLQKK